MRIERIELLHTKMELASLFETSLGVELFEQRINVRVDRDGVTGWGEWVDRSLEVESEGERSEMERRERNRALVAKMDFCDFRSATANRKSRLDNRQFLS